MYYRRKYKIFKIFEKMKNLDSSIFLFKYLIPFWHFLCILIFLLIKLTSEVQNSFIFISQTIGILKNNYLNTETASTLCLIGNLVIFLIFIIAQIRIYICPNYDEVKFHQNIEKGLLFISSILQDIIQMSICLIAFSFSIIYNHEGITTAILNSFLPLLGYMFYSYRRKGSYSLYGNFTVPVIILTTTSSNVISYLIVVVISTYSIFTQKLMIKKILLSYIAIIILLVTKITQLHQQTQSYQMQISFSLIGISMLFVSIGILKFRENLNFTNNSQKVQQYFQILINLKLDLPFKQLKFSKFYRFYRDIISLASIVTQQKSQKDFQIEKIIDTDPRQVTKQNLLFVLERYLKSQCKKLQSDSDLNIFNQIMLIKTHLALNYPMMVLIQELDNLNEQIQKSDTKHFECFFQLFDQIIKKFAIIKEGNLEPAHIIYINQLHQNFENKINIIFEKLQLFWSEITSQKVRKTSLQTYHAQIIELEEHIQTTYSKLKQIGTSARQQKILKSLKKFLNAYEETNKPDLDQIKKSIYQDDISIDQSFMILQNNIIKYMSKDLIRGLKKKESLVYENQEKSALFGKQFDYIVDEYIKNMTCQSQGEWFTIPIMCQDNFVQIKKVKIMWYPSLQAKNRIMMTFSKDLDLSQGSFFIYDCQSDTIKYFNQQFIRYFNIDEEKLQYQLKNCQIFFNQLFIQTETPIDELKSYLKQKNTIKCKIYLKNYVEEGSQFIFYVDIKALKSIQIDGQPAYFILQLTKLKDKNVLGETPITETSDNRTPINQKKIICSNKSFLAQKYENQTFFCKIPNQYESKITEKQAQLEQRGRCVYRYFIHIFFGIMFCTVLTFWVLDYKFLSDRIFKYEKQMTAIQNTSEQYNQLYQCYAVALQRYFAQKYPAQTKTLRMMPSFFWDLIMKKLEKQSLNRFLQLYLIQINDQPNKPVNYKIDFQSFSINTNSQFTTLIDFGAQFRNHIETSKIDFLLKNYNNFRHLTIQYLNSFQQDHDSDSIVRIFIIVKLIIMVGVTVLTVLTLVIIKKIETAVRTCYDLIDQISLDDIRKGSQQMNKIKQQITSDFCQTQQKSIDLKPIPQKNQFSTSIMKNQNSFMNSNEELVSCNNISIEHEKNSQNPQKQVISGCSFFTKNKPQTQTSNQQRIIQEPFIIRARRRVFFLFSLFIINSILYTDITNLLHQRDGMQQILDIKKRMYIQYMNIKRIQVDANLKPTFQDYFNKTMTQTYFPKNINILPIIPTHIIMPEFQQFAEQTQRIISSNMCDYRPIIPLPKYRQCEEYMNGILQKGFKETVDIYVGNAYEVSMLKLSEFAPFPCNREKCPIAAEHHFVGSLIGEVFSYLVTVLSFRAKEVFSLIRSETENQIFVKVLGLAVLLVLYVFEYIRLRNRCRQALKLFRMIPKELMCSMKVTTYMRKHDSLKMLDIL